MDSFTQDVRLALRALARSRAFTAFSVACIAIGVGLSTSLFSVINDVLLRPLSYRRADRLVEIWSQHTNPSSAREQIAPSYPDYLDWTRQTTVFDAMALTHADGLTIRDASGADPLTVTYVTDRFFDVMNMPPLLGVTFRETRPGAEPIIILGYRYWIHHYGGDRGVIGRVLSTDRGPVHVIGVMPQTFQYPAWADAWMPFGQIITDTTVERRDRRLDNTVVARLRVGTSLSRATTEMHDISARLATAYAGDDGQFTAKPFSLNDEVTGEIRPRLWLAMAAALAVLLVGCVDVSNLLIVRAMARSREIGILSALGATRKRLARMLFTETLVIAGCGCLLGLVLAAIAVVVLKGAAPDSIPRTGEIHLDGLSVGACVGFTVLASVLCGVAPTVYGTRTDHSRWIKSGSPAATSSATTGRLRSLFIVGQIGVTSALVCSATLLVESFGRLEHQSPGYQVQNLAIARIEPPATRYRSADALTALYEHLQVAVASITGVVSAGVVSHLPLGGSGTVTSFTIPGRPVEANNRPMAFYRSVDSTYFATVRQPLRGGRFFDAADMTIHTTAIVVSEELAKQQWPNVDPIGQRLAVDKQGAGVSDSTRVIDGTVVGVVANTKFLNLNEPPQPEVYVPLTVDPWHNAYLVARTRGSPSQLEPMLRSAINRVDPTIPVLKLTTGSDLVANDLRTDRFTTGVFMAFAGVALILALIGSYGVSSYAVAQRQHELGIRLALGASAERIVRMLLRHTAMLALSGVVLGLGISVLAAHVLAALLYSISSTDLITLVVTAALMIAVTLLAGYVPSRIALSSGPMRMIRRE